MGNVITVSLFNTKTKQLIHVRYRNEKELHAMLCAVYEAPEHHCIRIVAAADSVYLIDAKFEAMVAARFVALATRPIPLRVTTIPGEEDLAYVRVTVSVMAGPEKLFSPGEEAREDGRVVFKDIEAPENCHGRYVWKEGYAPIPGIETFIPMVHVMHMVVLCGILTGVCPKFSYDKITWDKAYANVALVIPEFDFPGKCMRLEAGRVYDAAAARKNYEKTVSWLSMRKVLMEKVNKK